MAYVPMPAITIDPREQSPWAFVRETIRKPVSPVGAYGVDGYEGQICIARHSLDELVDQLVHQRDGFLDDLEALGRHRWAALIVEGSVEAVLAGRYRSRAHPNSVTGFIASLLADGAPIIFVGNANAAGALAERLLAKFYSRAVEQVGT